MNQRELIRPDATIRYWTGGPVPAPTLVLLHGATLDHHAWDPQVDAGPVVTQPNPCRHGARGQRRKVRAMTEDDAARALPTHPPTYLQRRGHRCLNHLRRRHRRDRGRPDPTHHLAHDPSQLFALASGR
jgi:hypothetical protein